MQKIVIVSVTLKENYVSILLEIDQWAFPIATAVQYSTSLHREALHYTSQKLFKHTSFPDTVIPYYQKYRG